MGRREKNKRGEKHTTCCLRLGSQRLCVNQSRAIGQQRAMRPSRCSFGLKLRKKNQQEQDRLSLTSTEKMDRKMRFYENFFLGEGEEEMALLVIV